MASPALAGSQSSNTSSNNLSNNGEVREQVIDTYCHDGRCERLTERRVFRDDGRRYLDRRYRERHYREYWRERDDDD
jgi:hypothetical protein